MQLSSNSINGKMIIEFKGRLNAASSDEAEKYLQGIIDQKHTNLIINLKELDYISSSGLRIFLKTAKQMKEANGSVVLCELNSNVKNVFEMAGLDQIFEIKEKQEEVV